MRFATSIADLHAALRELRPAKKSVGLVPTMGALHAGHLSLIRRARQETDLVVVSIFVNPTQFGPSEDLESYPRPLQHDRELCEKAGVDVLFAPPTHEMYPGGYATYVLQERYTEAFEGEIRTGHFHGVCTVCAKLFNLVRPDVAFFGQKDYQQSVVIRRMVRDLNFDLKISLCPIVREPDGLAMSSRNVYLSPEEREQATVLYRALRKAQQMFSNGERRAGPLIAAMDEAIREAPSAKVDYLALVNPDTLREIRRIESEAMVLIAVRLGRTRLIDNCHLSAREHDKNAAGSEP
jgi:pantoate--beta-alanine ligase